MHHEERNIFERKRLVPELTAPPSFRRDPPRAVSAAGENQA
jgi:hypothetical protein